MPESPADRLGQFRGLPPSGWAWAAYEAGRNPYINLISIFVFIPYLASRVIGDPVKGQSLIATMTTTYGLIVALTAPLLGAIVERYGSRKPVLFVITVLMVPLIWSLWFVRPDSAQLSVSATLYILGSIGILFAYSEVVHNSMLLGAVGPFYVRRASGWGLSLGNFLGVVALVGVLWTFVLPGSQLAAHLLFIPDQPLLGLSSAAGEPFRVVGPLVASLFAVCAVPLFLFVPDAAPNGDGFRRAVKDGLSELGATLRLLRTQRDVGIFLLSRMLFTDGMTSIVMFIGVLAAGVMQWDGVQMLLFGVSLVCAATFGGLIGAWLDGWIGPKGALKLELAAGLFFLIALIGTTRDQVAYVWRFDGVTGVLWNAPLFRTIPELAYLVMAAGVALFVTAHYASSRTLLTRLAPADKLPAFFGLYALSGTATAWLGSLLVKLFTEALHSQQAGFVPIAALLVMGFVGMQFVKGGGRPPQEKLNQKEHIDA
jgi:MFS transporter, UMF1 family